ncbi:MAG: SGNH/GDSL hydrolase family protein [Fibrobacterota bacterium]
MAKICVFGDSIARGVDDRNGGGWAERLKMSLIKKGSGYDVYNLGISGNNTEDLIKRFHSEAEIRNPQIVVFFIGTNDSQFVDNLENHAVSEKKFKSNILFLADQAASINSKAVFLGIPSCDQERLMPAPWNPSKFYTEDSLRKYDRILKQACIEKSTDYLKTQGLYDPLSETSDGLHPDSKGHEKLFRLVEDFVLNLPEIKNE